MSAALSWRESRAARSGGRAPPTCARTPRPPTADDAGGRRSRFTRRTGCRHTRGPMGSRAAG
eukprot:scaffold7360_cov56-Isochrysis_galbana.AAC.1